MRTVMFPPILSLLLFSNVAAASANLDGKWVLTTVGCLSGKLGKLGLNNEQDIATGAMEETIWVSQAGVRTVMRERKPPIRKENFCETTRTSKWTASGDSVHVSETKFTNRESHGSFKCYEPSNPQSEKQRDYDFKVKLTHERLLVVRPDMIVVDVSKTKNHFCEDGSDFITTYKKQVE